MQAATHLSSVADSALIALRAQLEITRAFQSDILSTVYWSLGTLAAVVIVLVGLGWFANFRVYQRDLDGIRRELEALVAKNLAELKGSLESTLRDSLATARKELEQALSTRVESVARDVLVLRAEFYRAEFDSRSERNNHTMAATSAIGLLRTGLKLKWDTFINFALTGLVTSIEKGGGLTLGELQDATDLLMGVSDSFAILRERARASLAKAKTM